MTPSAAITTVWGTGNTTSAQMSAMPTAHAQSSYPWSMRTTSPASWDVGTVAQEASATARMTTTTEFNLNSASGLRGATDRAGALARRLQPASDTRLVVAVSVAEAPLEIALFARPRRS